MAMDKIDLNRKEREEVRKKNIGEYFLTYSQALRPWLIGLGERYKERLRADGKASDTAAVPLMPMQILPSYFERKADKEVAAFVGLLIPETENVVENVGLFRELLGQNPWEWLRNREFIRLGMGTMKNKKTGTVENWRIAKLCDRLWWECCGHGEETDIEQMVFEIAQMQHCPYFDVLTYLVEDCGVGNYFYKLRLLLMILACTDGFGLGLWEIPPEKRRSLLLCPHTSDLRTFLQTWFPDYRRYGTMDDAISLFGLERDCDFLYCLLAYKELQKKSPKICGKFATTYQRWYEIGARKKPYQFREILPRV